MSAIGVYRNFIEFYCFINTFYYLFFRFCRYCLAWVEPGTKCQQCAIDDEDYTLKTDVYFPDPAIRKEIYKQAAKCDNKICEWRGTFKEYLLHTEECQHKTVTCECGDTLPKRSLQKHKAERCNLRTIACSYCNAGIVARDSSQHLDVCNEYPVSCPNKCGKKLKRQDVERHTDVQTGDCEKRPCPFGCSDKEKNHVHTHAPEHCSILLQKVQSLQTMLPTGTGNQSELQSLEKRIGAVEKSVEEVAKKLPTKPPPETATRSQTKSAPTLQHHSQLTQVPSVAVAASGNPSESFRARYGYPDATADPPTGKFTLETMTEKQNIVESLAAVLNRYV